MIGNCHGDDRRFGFVSLREGLILKAGGGPQRPSFLCLPKEKKAKERAPCSRLIAARLGFGILRRPISSIPAVVRRNDDFYLSPRALKALSEGRERGGLASLRYGHRRMRKVGFC